MIAYALLIGGVTGFMTFNSLSVGINCNCLLNSVLKDSSNTEDIFCKKLRQKNPGPRDFESHWEMGWRAIDDRPIDMQHDCSGILSLKAISVNIFNDQTRSQVLEKYHTTFKISPQYNSSARFCSFKFKPNAGKVRHTPIKNDQSHYDFYKSDGFTMERLEIILIGQILDNV